MRPASVEPAFCLALSSRNQFAYLGVEFTHLCDPILRNSGTIKPHYKSALAVRVGVFSEFSSIVEWVHHRLKIKHDNAKSGQLFGNAFASFIVFHHRPDWPRATPESAAVQAPARHIGLATSSCINSKTRSGVVAQVLCHNSALPYRAS
jgi:hypothetical protein